MFPEVNYDFETEEENLVAMQSTKIGRTPLYDFDRGRYVVRDGKIIECTQKEAVRQWVGFLVKTAADKFDVYDGTDFGTYIENYIGYKDTAFVASEIKREVEEKALDNRAIESIEDFQFKKEGDKLTISLTVVMTDKTEVEVETSV
jgi:hypothetical protein